MGIVKAGVVLWCHKAVVLKGYHGWTKQRSSAEGFLGREGLQRRRVFRLRCHNFKLTKPGINQRYRYRFWAVGNLRGGHGRPDFCLAPKLSPPPPPQF